MPSPPEVAECQTEECSVLDQPGPSHCDDALWADSGPADGLVLPSAQEALNAWAAGSEERQRLATNPAWLLACAQEALLTGDHGRHRLALLLLRHAAELAASIAWKASRVLEEPVPCRRPSNASERHRRYDEKLLALTLEPGRACSKGACATSRCGLLVLDGAVSAAEAQTLVEHGESVLARRAEKAESKPTSGKAGKAEVDLHLSAQFGERRAHLLFLHVLERLRRLVARAAGVPASWVHIASHFLSRIDAGEQAEGLRASRADGAQQDSENPPSVENASLNHSHTVHCDESSFARFHHSGVLWLTPQDGESGGEVEFWGADQRAWRRVVQPAVGRVALFTSGWENIHRVTQLRQGRRWSLPLFASLVPPFNVSRLTKGCVWPGGSRQWEYCEDRLQQWLSAPDEDFL